MNYPKILSIIGCFVLCANFSFAQEISAHQQLQSDSELIDEGSYQIVIPNIKFNDFELSVDEKRDLKALQLNSEDTTVSLENEIEVRIMSKAKEQEGIVWIKYALK